jgi:hypothetical protein
MPGTLVIFTVRGNPNLARVVNSHKMAASRMERDNLKNYRCIFNFAHGRTTVDVVAHDAACALSEAERTVQGNPAAIEVWDETGLVLERNAAALRQQSPLSGNVPRR